MQLYIKDEATVALVTRLAKQHSLTPQDAVRLAVQAELDRARNAVPMRERIHAWRQANPFPPSTGLPADKAFFEDLSEEP